MAYKTEINVGGRLTEVTHFDHTAQEIDDAVDAAAKIPELEQEVEALSAAGQTGGNQLHNWYFAPVYDSGGSMVLPINQRGIALDTAFTTAGSYFLDRWILVSGTVTLTAAGLVLFGTIRQKRELALGRADFAASVLCASGEATAEYDDNLMYFDVTSDGGAILAAKLEPGAAQTLYKELEDGSRELLDLPPDPALELMKCQRYLRPLMLSEDSQYPFHINAKLTGGSTQIQFGTSMRTAPSLLLLGHVASTFRIVCTYSTGTTKVYNPSKINATQSSEIGVAVVFTLDAETTIAVDNLVSATVDGYWAAALAAYGLYATCEL